MSKDFGSNGLRAGVFISQHNPTVIAAAKLTGIFAWISSYTDIAWSCMLEDTDWLTSYIAENNKRLAQQYNIVVDFLNKHEIPFIKGGAGFFIWIDLGRWVGSAEEDAKLFEKMIKNGIYVANSVAFFAETYGWYRISYSMSKKVLDIALDRLEKCLE